MLTALVSTVDALRHYCVTPTVQEHKLKARQYKHWIGTTTTTPPPTTVALDELSDEERLKEETKQLNEESKDIVM